MAEEKKEKSVAKKEKAPGNNKIAKFFKDYKSELGKIVWLSREETMKKSWVVIASMLISSAVIGLLDLGFSKLIIWVGGSVNF